MSKVLISLFLSLLIVSCNTYKTYYESPTIDINDIKSEHRIDMSHGMNDDLSKFKDLRMLDLSGRTDINLNNILKSITNPKKLSVLILDSLQLNSLPSSLVRFRKLQHLSLVDNPDLDLGSSFISLKKMNIQFINLSRNKIQELPQSIVGLKSLSELKMSHNNLSDENSYGFLSQCENLESLWLDYNNLFDLPSNMSLMKGVRNLYLDHNHMSNLPASIVEMEKLRILHIGHNHFTKLPAPLANMEDLMLLHINNNPISIIPDVYGSQKTSLGGLVMDNNMLKETDKENLRIWFKHFFLLSID